MSNLKPFRPSPGPWDYIIGKEDGVIYADVTIAHIPDDADGWQSNMRLMAHAPELLARLEQVLPYLEHPDVRAMFFAKSSGVMATQIRDSISLAKYGVVEKLALQSTCGCGLYIHPARRDPKAIHIHDCVWAKNEEGDNNV